MAKQATRTSILTDQKYLGKEPEFGSEELSMPELIRAYNWYNYFLVSDDSKKYIADFCAAKGVKINISKHNVNTYGWLARIVSRGAKVDSNTTQKFEQYIEGLRAKKNDKIEVKEESVIETKSTNRMELWAPDFEEALDNFKSPFSAYNYLTSRNVPQIYAKQLAEYYEAIRNEVQSAYNKEDEDLVFAYKVHTRTELKSLLTFLNNLVSDCEKYLGNVKKERKPRKVKVKSAESLLKHMKYQKSDATLKIVSEDPTKIIGASSLYVINTKYKILTVFHAKDENGLGVNRTAITNYDETKSMSKRIGRKVNDVIEAINKGTKRSRVKIMSDIKTDAIKLSERINENTIIMKVEK